MIGYFNDRKGSQDYPLGILKLWYGSRGDYITMVKKFGAGKFARRFARKFKHSRTIKTKKFTAPAKLPGIDFSDHLNYWRFNNSAIMVTNTAFYRNKNYHRPSDRMETLDMSRMAKVINGVCYALLEL